MIRLYACATLFVLLSAIDVAAEPLLGIWNDQSATIVAQTNPRASGGHFEREEDGTGTVSVSPARSKVAWSTTARPGGAPPPTPVLQGPGNGATLVPFAPVILQWSNVSTADDYRVQISTHPSEFGNPYRVVSTIVNTNAYTPTVALDEEVTYYWRVRARNSDGASDWSEPWSFTRSRLVAPANEAPSALLPITFSWSSAWDDPSGNGYNLQVSVHPGDFSSPVIDTWVNGYGYSTGLTPLDNGQVYYWRVGTVGVVMEWSGIRSFTAVMPLPPVGQPALIAPEDDAFDILQPIQLEWHTHPDASAYTLKFKRDDHEYENSDTISVVALADTTYTFGGLDEGTRYVWQIVPLNPGGEGPPTQRTFTTYLPAPEERPLPLLPLPEAVRVPLQPAFQWSRLARARSHHLQLSTDSTFTTTDIDTVVTGFAFTLTDSLEGNTRYYWRVAAANHNGEGPFSDSLRWFETLLPVPPPVLTAPVDDATVDNTVPILLHWAGDPTVDTYEVELDDAYDFTTTVISTSTTTDSAVVDGLQFVTDYWWRVRAWRGPDSSAWVGPWHFTTDFDPDAPKVLPLDRALDVSVSVDSLDWSDEYPPYGTPFHLRLGSSPYFENPLIDDANVNTVEYAIPGSLQPGTTYYWQLDPDPNSPLPALEDLFFTTAGGTLDRVGLASGVWRRIHPGASTIVCSIRYWSVDGAQSYNIETGIRTWAVDSLLSRVTVPHQAGTTFQREACRGLSATNAADAYWRVQACANADGTQCGPWSAYRPFADASGSTSVPGLNPPQLESPEPGETVAFPVTLRWRSAPRADAYHVAVYDEMPTPLSIPIIHDTTAALMWTIDLGSHPATEFFWRAQSCLHGLCSAWSSVRSFTLNSPLSTPVLTSPAPNAQQQPIPVLLNWESVNGADNYELDVATDAGFANKVVEGEHTQLDQAWVGALSPDTDYWWRVRAWTDSTVRSLWSEVRGFRTDLIPAVPVPPVTPAQHQVEVPVMPGVQFSWQPSPGATFYRWRLSLEAGMNPTLLAAQEDSLLAPAHQMAGLLTDTTYYWQAQACTGTGCSAWSLPAWQFTTETTTLPPPPPGSDEPVRYYYLTDHLGSVRATLKEDGTVVHYDDYYPFGAPLPVRSGGNEEDGDPTGKPRFTSHEREWEQDDAVYYAGARYYDALIGRWNAVDPLAEKHPDWSPYNYVLDNPLRLVDPDGQQISAINGEWVHFRAARHTASGDPSRTTMQVYEARNQQRMQNDAGMAKAYLVMASFVPVSYVAEGVIGTTADLATGGFGFGSLLNWAPGGRIARGTDDVIRRGIALLKGAPGVNIMARSDALNYRYNIAGGQLGAGTALTDVQAIEDVIGPLTSGNRMTISADQAGQLEKAFGLPTGRLAEGGIISIVNDVASRAPRSPLSGNDLFLGGGQGLPGGGPEINIAPINTAGGGGIWQIILETE